MSLQFTAFSITGSTLSATYEGCTAARPTVEIRNSTDTATIVRAKYSGSAYSFSTPSNSYGLSFGAPPASGTGTFSLNLGTLPNGIYVVKLYNADLSFFAMHFAYSDSSPVTLPTPIVTATPGDSSVTLSWIPVYGMYLYSVAQDGTTIAAAYITPYTVYGLTNGQAYTFGVKAVGDGGSFVDGGFGTVTATPTAGGGGGGGAVCFLGAAPVLTPAGYKRIDSLAVGDLVRTADGRDVAVVRAKHQRIEAPSAAVNPYVIPVGLWGATENLAISPRHCVAVSGRGMVEARELGLKQMPMRAAFDYYNLELPEWDNMMVAGVEVESLAPKKRVVMTVEQLAKLAAGIPVEKLARRVTVLADGKVAVSMTRKERRMCA